MMPSRAQSPKRAEREFLAWANSFSEGLLVMLQVYADESGTHDVTGALKGAREAVVFGLAAPLEFWGGFSANWQSVLNKHDARFFHFCEWSEASQVARNKRKPRSSFAKNPYRGWSQAKLDDFLLELATLISSSNILPLGQGLYTNVFHDEKKDGNIPENLNPYEYCVGKFFDRVVRIIALQRSPWKRVPISFVFDRSDPQWMSAIAGQFHAGTTRHRVFRAIAFADKQIALPLQAADMIAYRVRQITEQWVDGNKHKPWAELDSLLFKTIFDSLDIVPGNLAASFLQARMQNVASAPMLPAHAKTFGAEAVPAVAIKNANTALSMLAANGITPSRISATADSSVLFEILSREESTMMEFFGTGEIAVVRKTDDEDFLFDFTKADEAVACVCESGGGR